MPAIWVILVSLLYAAMLFAVAWLGDRHASLTQRDGVRPVIYSLALAVYCSSWTFYGAVGTAARHGLGYLPIYLGPMLLFLLGWRMLERLALVAGQHNTVSIADFIASRFGRAPRLAALVALIALIAAVPYLALQYQAVVTSLSVLTGLDARGQRWGDPALYVAAIMALFAILFGTRQVDASEHRPGLMLAVALESVIKLLALLAVGVLALRWLGAQPHSAGQAIAQLIQRGPPTGFVAQTLLAFAAMLCLPRQFHVAVVECGDVADIRRARWLFGGYLLLISLMVLPIAAAGQALFHAAGTVTPDSFVLALPLALGHEGLALVAYIGGFSAATGMVIVVSVALSNMVSNDLVMPWLLRRQPQRLAAGADTAALVLWVRRAAIVLLALLAYGYSRGMDGRMPLASLGLMAFAAVAQFAPALVAGLYWPGASRRGVEAGLLAGFALWGYTLLLPSLAESGWLDTAWIEHGPWGQQWLRPHQLLGSSVGLVLGSADWDAITHGTFWSLLANAATLVLVSLRWRPSLTEQMQAQPFLAPQHAPRPGAGQAQPAADQPGAPLQADRLRVRDLQTVASRIVGQRTAERAFAEHARRHALTLSPELRADAHWLRLTELLLAGAVGAASARLLLTRALQGSGMELAAIVSVLDEAGQELRFNRDILLATLEHIDPGVSVVDAEMRLVAWNRRYQQLFNYPAGMLYVGRSVADLIAHNLRHDPLGLAREPAQHLPIEEQVQKRIALMRQGRAYTLVRELRDGRFIEMRGHPLPNGGYVTSYSDISAFKHAERKLRDVNETLEQRVAQRSRELAAAHESRSRYLTAISHDVLQPIHATRLFASALREEAHPAQMRQLAGQIDAALGAAEDLLDGVLDISRLDAGALQPDIQAIDLHALLGALQQQYAPLAAKRRLQWRLRISARHGAPLWVRSDARLLRRVLQNFAANALRYTQHGGVLMTARPRGSALLLQVWDTGPGIPPAHLARIYDEFHRYQQVFDWDGRGLGLGLSICQRIARLLQHPLQARSTLGRGSMFAITVPLVGGAAAQRGLGNTSAAQRSARPALATPFNPLQGMQVLCLDNSPDILQGMQALLGRWGIAVHTALNLQQALQIARDTALDCLLVDYHLHERLDGLAALQALRQARPGTPGALVTADGSDQLKAQAAAHGVVVLNKPIKPAALRAFLLAQRRTAG